MARSNKTGGQLHEVDPLIPILNLVCMLIPLLIFGAVFVSYRTLTVSAPDRTRTVVDSEEDDALQLVVMITDQGFHIRVNPKHRLSWMVSASSIGRFVPDIPKRDDGYDFHLLKERLTDLKERHPRAFEIVLGAEDNIAYDIIIKTMDASRGKQNELFPNVHLTRGVG